MFPFSQKELFTAIEDNDLHGVRRLLRRDPQLVNQRNEFGETPLHAAIILVQEEMARLILACGADPAARTRHGKQTALHLAEWRGASSEFIKLLLEISGDRMPVDVRDADRWTPLHYAAFHLRPEIASLLIEHGADVNAKNLVAQNPIHLAAKASVYGQGDERERRERIIWLLLDSGAVLNFGVGANRDLMLIAIEEGKPDLLRLLLERGGNPDSRRDGYPLLYDASDWMETQGLLECLHLLIQAGAQIDGVVHSRNRSEAGRTALHAAAERGHLQIVQILVQSGADVHRETSFGETACNLALRTRHTEVAQYLQSCIARAERS